MSLTVAACASDQRLSTIRPAPVETAKTPAAAYTCLAWPTVEILDAKTAAEGWAVVAEKGEPSQLDCMCKLARRGLHDQQLGLVAGDIIVPPVCGIKD